ncbi:MAG: hypothetical protein IPK28_16450 [Devosia sp.]|nr:hypothetical protein [Devosia sp.]
MGLSPRPAASPLPSRQAEPIRLAGEAETRGRGQASARDADAIAVRAATVGQVALARAEGLIDPDAERYLAEQRRFHLQHDPRALDEIRGIADGFGIAEADLFAHLHLSLLRARKGRREQQRDGCSAWAVSGGPDGPLLVKNRDLSGRDFGVQRVMLHTGPDIVTGGMLCVGSLGSPAAYSSGINSWGLALADTHVVAPAPAVGWLRYFLMTRLLAACRSVDEALAMIRAAPHAGGGALVLADAYGATAAVDFAGPRATTASATPVWRTNHYPGEDASPPPTAQADTIEASSRGRFRFLEQTLPDADWDVARAARLMATHTSPLAEGPLLCAHRESGTSQTLSCSIYRCRSGQLFFSDGNPCQGDWVTYCLADHAADAPQTAKRH